MGVLGKAAAHFFQYREYIAYSVRSELKLQFSGKYLGALWWVLDPVFYMLAYILVVHVIFRRGGPDYPVFIFTALLCWKWTSSCIAQNINSIRARGTLLSQVYVPKYVFSLIRATAGTADYLFGLLVLFVLNAFFCVPFTLHYAECIPVIAVNYVFILGVSLCVAHLGVYFADLNNIFNFLIRMWFYLSPALYSVADIPAQYRWLWRLNPMTLFYESYRNCFLYGKSPDYAGLGVLLGVSLAVVYGGLNLVYKYDRNYTKVV